MVIFKMFVMSLMSCHVTGQITYGGAGVLLRPQTNIHADYPPRCIVESPDTSGNGVDFCRLPVDCASVCSQAGTRRILMAAKIGFYHNHGNILTENRFFPC